MTYTFDETVSQSDWESFLLGLDYPPFLQSYTMRSMHNGLNDETLPIGIRDKEGTLIGVAMGIVVDARRGKFLWFPYGPVLAGGNWKDLFPQFTEYIAKRGRELKCDFLRSSPFIINSESNYTLFEETGWKPAPMHMLSEHVWWLDITEDEDAIMKGMRKTMRNLIRRAERDGVTVRKSQDLADLDIYLEIQQDTAKRHGFVPYSDAYIREQVRAFKEHDDVVIFIAEYEGKPIASGVMMYYGNMGSYHHGASLSEYRKIPATYLMQWEAIKEAKARGCERYNFWGVVPEEHFYSPILKKPHPFIGVTKFKTGFGGERLDLIHCHDYPLTLKYKATFVIEMIRRYKRGFFAV